MLACRLRTVEEMCVSWRGLELEWGVLRGWVGGTCTSQVNVHAGSKLLCCASGDDAAGVGGFHGLRVLFVVGRLEYFDLVLVLCAFEESVYVEAGVT